MIVQLDPMIPVLVVAAPGNHVGRAVWPGGLGFAVALTDYSQEHPTLWKVAMQDGGVVWDVPQSYIRLRWNASMERMPCTA